MYKANPARGTRDFLPDQIRKREYVIGVIKSIYEKHGFEPLETPTIENLSTLTNKYGEEGDQLMFKILKRREKLKRKLESGKIQFESELSDLALRYDLTVPLARVVANYRHRLPRFFKRYQVQPVWRADRPARGRYREFYQCDVDAIGSKSMLVEAEFCSMASEILKALGFKNFEIRLNHRNILFAMLAAVGIDEADNANALIALDKLDKIGRDGVFKEFENRNIGCANAEELLNIFDDLEGLDYLGAFSKISNFVSDYEYGKSGLSEIAEIFSLIDNEKLRVDASLARGLGYYTGVIYEINVPDLGSSIASGGRYDNLIGMFGKEEIPAVGLSLGLDRILLVMEERGMFPKDLISNAADVLVTVWSKETAEESLKLAHELRQKKLRVAVYPQADKLSKQFKYANRINVQYVYVLGESEISQNKITIKKMKTGFQETIDRETLLKK